MYDSKPVKCFVVLILSVFIRVLFQEYVKGSVKKFGFFRLLSQASVFLVVFLSSFAISNVVRADIVAVPFAEGFVGTIGTSNTKANDVFKLSSIGISASVVQQNSSTNVFESPTGNDIPVTLVLRQGTETFRIPGNISWKEKDGGTLRSFGFTPSSSAVDFQAFTLSYTDSNGNQTITLDGSSNYGLVRPPYTISDYNITDGVTDISGSNDPVDIDDLNAYLQQVQAVRPYGPIFVDDKTVSLGGGATTATPTLTGEACLVTSTSDPSVAGLETISVEVDGVFYDNVSYTIQGDSTLADGTQCTSGTGFVVSAVDWSLTTTTAIAAGTYDVVATITATSPYFNQIFDASLNELTIVGSDPLLRLTKSLPAITDLSDGVDVGDELVFTITLENLGVVAVSMDSLTDSFARVSAGTDTSLSGTLSTRSCSGGDSTNDTNLAPSETCTWTYTYVVTSNDLSADSFKNLATLQYTVGGNTYTLESTSVGNQTTGTPTGGVYSGSATTRDIVLRGLKATKVVTSITDNGDGITSAGDIVNYSITLENIGDVRYENVSLDSDQLTRGTSGTGTALVLDTSPSTPDNVADTHLDPAETWTYTASYTLVQDDINAGGISNIATFKATPESGTEEIIQTSATGNTVVGTSNPLPTTTTITPNASLYVVKTETSGNAAVGETLSWNIVVTNDGNVTLTDISVSDTLKRLDAAADADRTVLSLSSGPTASSWPGTTGTLAPGQSVTFVATYALVQADIDAGGVSNSAVGTGSSPGNTNDVTDGSGTASDNDTATVTTMDQTASIKLVKTSTVADTTSDNITGVGDTVTYTFKLRNTGNVALGNVVLSEPEDQFTGVGSAPTPVYVSGDANSDGLLDLDETWTYNASYILLKGDVDSTAEGFIENVAVVTADIPGSGETLTQNSSAAEDSDEITTTFLGSITGTLIKNSVPMSGITVKLVDSANNVILTTTTDANGDYFFTNMPAGDYQLRFISPDGTPFTGYDGVGDQGVSGGLNSVSDVSIAYGAGKIRNFEEVNGIAIDPSGVVYDATSRTPIEGATVRLLFNGNAIDDSWLVGGSGTQVTEEDGIYAFFLQDPAETGEYTVVVDAPDGYKSVTATSASEVIAPAGEYDGTTSLGGGVVEIVPSAAAPVVGGDTTYYLVFNLQFGDWTDAATLSNGVIHNHIPVDRISMGMTVSKVADISNLSQPPKIGETITYEIRASNTGSGSYSAIEFDDPLTDDSNERFKEGDVNGSNTLDPDETWVWTTSYVLTQEDLARGKVENTATVSGTTPAGFKESYESSEEGNSAEGVGKGTPTVVELNELIPLIIDDLKTILSDDLAATMRQQSAGMKSYAKSARSRLDSGSKDCGALVTEVIANRDINFATASDIILPESYPVLDDIAQAVNSCAASDLLSIEGHTDDRGSLAYNQDLSERRAASVKRALISRDVASDKLFAVGFGETRPIATNDTDEGMEMNRRVEFVTAEARKDVTPIACSGDVVSDRQTDIVGGSAKLALDNSFYRTQENCSGDAWRTTEGNMSLLTTNTGVQQWMFNISTRTEKKLNDDRVFGWFVGAYGSRNQITGLADGTIDGLGVNGGIFGANRLAEALFLDYYLGASAGKHNFDLDFDRGFDINAAGDYRYFAYYGGVAVSGDIERGSMKFSPRVGLDLAYTNGADVNVTASNEYRSETGKARLDAMNGGRLYGEIDFLKELESATSEERTLGFTPLAFCDQAIGETEVHCGYGARINYSEMDLSSGNKLTLSFGVEATKQTTSQSFGLAYEQSIFGGLGRSSTGVTMSQTMKPAVSYNVNVDF